MEQQKIVAIPDIVAYFQGSLHIVVKLVQVEIAHPLRSEVAYRHVLAAGKRVHDIFNQPERVRAFYFPAYDVQQHGMVNAGIKL